MSRSVTRSAAVTRPGVPPPALQSLSNYTPHSPKPLSNSKHPAGTHVALSLVAVVNNQISRDRMIGNLCDSGRKTTFSWDWSHWREEFLLLYDVSKSKNPDYPYGWNCIMLKHFRYPCWYVDMIPSFESCTPTMYAFLVIRHICYGCICRDLLKELLQHLCSSTLISPWAKAGSL